MTLRDLYPDIAARLDAVERPEPAIYVVAIDPDSDLPFTILTNGYTQYVTLDTIKARVARGARLERNDQ